MLRGANGSTATVVLDGGHGLTFHPETLTFTTPETNPGPVVVVMNGRTFDVEPGGTVNAGVLTVALDIKPGGVPNSINLRSRGVLPVAILTTATFDAATVSVGSVRLGSGAAGALSARLVDVDGDRDRDLLLQFETRDTGLACGDTIARLTGSTRSGTAIEGRDSVHVVACR